MSATCRFAPRAAAAAFRMAFFAGGWSQRYPSRYVTAARATRSASTSSGPMKVDAPRYVHCVRCASGVTITRHRPVAGPVVAGTTSKYTPSDRRSCV